MKIFFFGLGIAGIIAVGWLLTPKIYGMSEFRQKAERIAALRGGGGGTQDSILLLSLPVKISEDDYLLMGCDNATAERNFPNVPERERMESQWFAGAPDLSKSSVGSNYHASRRRDGTWEFEAFIAGLPRKQFQVSPEEVAWHYLRVKELRSQKMPVEQRIETMNREAKEKPWLSMR